MSTIFFSTAAEAFDNYPRGQIPALDDHIQLLDILQLVIHCRKKLALASTTHGFAWFRLDAAIAAAPEVWDNYVAWYISEYDVDPLSLLESDAPSPPCPVPLRAMIISSDPDHQLPASPLHTRALSLLDYSFQMLRKSAIDRARSKVYLQSASNFHMFAAWFQLRSFRDDSVRFNSLVQAYRFHLLSSFRSWRQSTVELAVVSRNYSAATNLFLAKPLCPAWPIFPASLSLRSGWLRSLSVTETQGNLWEDRRLCFRPFIKWLSSTRSPSLPEDLSARELSRPADEFSTPAGSFMLGVSLPGESNSLAPVRLSPRQLFTASNGVCAATQLVPPENEISACASREPSHTSTRTMFPCYPSLIVRSLSSVWHHWRQSFGRAMDASRNLDTASNWLIRNYLKFWRRSPLPLLYARRIRLFSLRRHFSRWRKRFAPTLADSLLQSLATDHISKCHFTQKCLFFMSWIFYKNSRTLEIVRSASATSFFRFSSCRAALRNFRSQASLSSRATTALHRGLTLYCLNPFRALSAQCRELSDSAYSCNSAVKFHKKHRFSSGWAKLFDNLAANKFSSAADVKSWAAFRNTSFYSFKVGLQIQKQTAESKKHGNLLYSKKHFDIWRSRYKEISRDTSSFTAALSFLRRNTLLLSWNKFSAATAVSILDVQIDRKIWKYWRQSNSFSPPRPPLFGHIWAVCDAFRLLRTNARWFSFAVQRHVGLSLDLWRAVTVAEMTALKPVRRASPSSALEWITLIRDKNVCAAYLKLSKFWIRLNNKRWLTVKFLHMVALCKTRAHINRLWTAFTAWQDYIDEVAPALHSSVAIGDLFSSLRPNMSSALVRMMNEATSQAAPGSPIIPSSHVLLPISSWPLDLRSRVDLIRIFKKLSGPLVSDVEDYQLSLLNLLSPLPSEMRSILENPARLWSCSLTHEEFLLADNVEMKQHYTFVWLIPLWLSQHDADAKHSFMFWNCHAGTQIELNLDTYLSSGRQITESDLIDVILTFGGASFVEPVFLLPDNFNVFDRRSIDGDSADSATSISAAAGCVSPSAVPQDLMISSL